MCLFFSLLAASFLAGREEVKVSPVDQTKPPRIVDIEVPKGAAGVPVVGLKEYVTGEADESKTGRPYVLVAPLLSSEQPRPFWVQGKVTFQDGRFRTLAQFGEEDLGRDEYFLIVVMWSDREYTVGQRLPQLPIDGTAYSKAHIVIRR